MKEAILNAMNPIEKKILEKEVQKIHIPEEPIPFDDFGKKIRYVKKIRELLDQDAELKEIKLLFGRKGLHQGWYYKNETPLASYVYWYGRGCGREDVCRWAVEASTTIDGLLQVQEPSHMEEIAKLFVCADKDNAVPFRRIYLRDELCWTDAPNYLLVVMSGNIPLLKMFEEKDREMTEDNMEYWEYICYMDQTPGARKTYYSIRRETIVGEFYIPNILTAAILSGSPEMLDYCIDHYDIDNMMLGSKALL